MKTTIPQPFEIEAQVYDYTERNGFPLPTLFMEEFEGHFLAKQTRWADWQRVLINWIRDASPRGRFHIAQTWESKLAETKRRESAKYKRQMPLVLEAHRNATHEDSVISVEEREPMPPMVRNELQSYVRRIRGEQI